MKKTKLMYLFIVLGIIIVVTIGVREGNKGYIAQKAELKSKVEQFSQDIKDEETRLAEATTDTSLVSAKSQTDIDTLKIAVDSAKKVYANPYHTQEDITISSNSLITADDVFDTSASTYQPLEETPSTDTTSDTTVDTTNITSTGTDEQVWQYCEDRWTYYDTLNGEYSADKYDTEVFNDASSNFGITASEAQSKWDKVDAVKKGVSN